MVYFIVYSRFSDSPSIIRGIFSSLEAAKEVCDKWGDRQKDIQEIVLDVEYDEPIVLE